MQGRDFVSNESLISDMQAMGIRALIDLEVKPLQEKLEQAEKRLKDFSEAPWRMALEGHWGPEILAAGNASEALRLAWCKGRADMGKKLRDILAAAVRQLDDDIDRAERDAIRFGGKPPAAVDTPQDG